jgi:hypothetical protein
MASSSQLRWSRPTSAMVPPQLLDDQLMKLKQSLLPYPLTSISYYHTLTTPMISINHEGIWCTWWPQLDEHTRLDASTLINRDGNVHDWTQYHIVRTRTLDQQHRSPVFTASSKTLLSVGARIAYAIGCSETQYRDICIRSNSKLLPYFDDIVIRSDNIMNGNGIVMSIGKASDHADIQVCWFVPKVIGTPFRSYPPQNTLTSPSSVSTAAAESDEVDQVMVSAYGDITWMHKVEQPSSTEWLKAYPVLNDHFIWLSGSPLQVRVRRIVDGTDIILSSLTSTPWPPSPTSATGTWISSSPSATTAPPSPSSLSSKGSSSSSNVALEPLEGYQLVSNHDGTQLIYIDSRKILVYFTVDLLAASSTTSPTTEEVKISSTNGSTSKSAPCVTPRYIYKDPWHEVDTNKKDDSMNDGRKIYWLEGGYWLVYHCVGFYVTLHHYDGQLIREWRGDHVVDLRVPLPDDYERHRYSHRKPRLDNTNTNNKAMLSHGNHFLIIIQRDESNDGGDVEKKSYGYLYDVSLIVQHKAELASAAAATAIANNTNVKRSRRCCMSMSACCYDRDEASKTSKSYLSTHMKLNVGSIAHVALGDIPSCNFINKSMISIADLNTGGITIYNIVPHKPKRSTGTNTRRTDSAVIGNKESDKVLQKLFQLPPIGSLNDVRVIPSCYNYDAAEAIIEWVTITLMNDNVGWTSIEHISIVLSYLVS